MTVRVRRAPARTGPRRLLAAALAAGVLAPALLTGCAQSVAPIERLSRKAAQRVRHAHPEPKPPGSFGGAPAPATPLKTPPRNPPDTPPRNPLETPLKTFKTFKTPKTQPKAHDGPLKSPAARPRRHVAHMNNGSVQAPASADACRHWGLRAPFAPAPSTPAHPAPRAARGPYALPPVVDHVGPGGRLALRELALRLTEC